MLSKEAVEGLIFKALKNLNEERPPHEQIPLSPETRLFGTNAVLDSLSLVSVIVDVESAVSEASGREVALTDDRAMSQPVSPFTSISTLTGYILSVLSAP